MRFIKTFCTVVVLAVFAVVAQAQVSVYGGFQNLNVGFQNLPGVGASVEYKIGEYGDGKFHFSAVADGAFHHDTNNVLNRFQFLGGGKAAYGKKVQVFGRALYGVTRFDQQNRVLRDFARATVSIGGGVDVRVGNGWVFRPAQFDLQYIDERAARYSRLFTGFGFEF